MHKGLKDPGLLVSSTKNGSAHVSVNSVLTILYIQLLFLNLNVENKILGVRLHSSPVAICHCVVALRYNIERISLCFKSQIRK